MANVHLVGNAYRTNQNQVDIHPVKLIFMMYERVISHLELAAVGIEQEDPKMRGENLSRAIAIISELNASIKKDDESEAAQFLRGLYASILNELSSIAISNDLDILSLAKKYMITIKEIWQETAMEEAGLNKKTNDIEGADEYDELKPLERDSSADKGHVGDDKPMSSSQRLSVSVAI